MLLTNKVSQFATDSNTVHAWVHGPASGTGSTVTTDAGPLRTPAKLIADLETSISAGVFGSLPTSPTGLSSGSLWVDAAAAYVLKRVP